MYKWNNKPINIKFLYIRCVVEFKDINQSDSYCFIVYIQTKCVVQYCSNPHERPRVCKWIPLISVSVPTLNPKSEI